MDVFYEKSGGVRLKSPLKVDRSLEEEFSTPVKKPRKKKAKTPTSADLASMDDFPE